MEMCFNEIHICVCLWAKERNKKCILCSNLELVKVGCCHFPHPYDGPRKSHPFLRGPLFTLEFDMPAVIYYRFKSDMLQKKTQKLVSPNEL
jgi:hypothetical protein